MSGSELQGQEEAAACASSGLCDHLQWIVYTDGGSKTLKCCK